MFTLVFLLFTRSVFAQELPNDQLWDAIKNNNVSAVIALIESGVSANSASKVETPLTYAIKFDSTTMVEALLDHGASANQAQPVSEFTPLMVAAKHNKAEVVDLLLAHGAQVNFMSVFGRNPLHIAALNDSIEVAHILLTKTNVDVNARGKLCPLAVASRQGYLDFVELILKEAKVAPSAICLESAKNMATLNQHSDVLAILISSAFHDGK